MRKDLNGTIFYKEFYKEPPSNASRFVEYIVCRLLNLVSDEHAPAYFAIRDSGIDFILNSYHPRKVFPWEVIYKVEILGNSFLLSLKTGLMLTVKSNEIDYDTVQAIKDAFGERGLLVSSSSQ